MKTWLRWAVFAAVVVSAVVILRVDAPTVAQLRPAATTTAPATTAPAAAVDPARARLDTLARSYITAWQYGIGSGGPVWVAKLNDTASPELVKATVFTTPEDINPAPVTVVTVETVGAAGGGRILVELRDGTQLRLLAAPTAAGLRIVTVEDARP